MSILYYMGSFTMDTSSVKRHPQKGYLILVARNKYIDTLENFITPDFLCEIANKMVPSCTESEDHFNYSEVTFQYYPERDSTTTEILIAANDKMDAERKA